MEKSRRNMKYFVASDVHGSAFWAKRIAQEFAQSNADWLVLLGDVYNHGPRNPFPQDYNPMEVANVFNALAHKIVAICGNCDSQVDQMISNFTFVQNNFAPCGNKRLFFTHGHVFNKDNTGTLCQGDVMFYGHFHVNEIVEANGVTCVNVGSCALPKDGLHTYCIVDEMGISIFTFDGKLVATKPFN